MCFHWNLLVLRVPDFSLELSLVPDWMVFTEFSQGQGISPLWTLATASVECGGLIGSGISRSLSALKFFASVFPQAPTPVSCKKWIWEIIESTKLYSHGGPCFPCWPIGDKAASGFGSWGLCLEVADLLLSCWIFKISPQNPQLKAFPLSPSAS